MRMFAGCAVQNSSKVFDIAVERPIQGRCHEKKDHLLIDYILVSWFAIFSIGVDFELIGTLFD